MSDLAKTAEKAGKKCKQIMRLADKAQKMNIMTEEECRNIVLPFEARALASIMLTDKLTGEVEQLLKDEEDTLNFFKEKIAEASKEETT